MPNPYDANFEVGNGDVRLSGVIDFTDSTNQPGGYQPSAPTSGSFPSGSWDELDVTSPTTVTSGVETELAFVVGGVNAGLFDYTDPLRPAAVEGGLYAFHIVCSCRDGSPHAGKTAHGRLDMDVDVWDVVVTNQWPLEISSFGVDGLITSLLYLTAGAKLAYAVTHNIGAPSDFALFGHIQRVT